MAVVAWESLRGVGLGDYYTALIVLAHARKFGPAAQEASVPIGTFIARKFLSTYSVQSPRRPSLRQALSRNLPRFPLRAPMRSKWPLLDDFLRDAEANLSATVRRVSIRKMW